MITISKNSLHLLLGGLHLGSFKHKGYDPCCCENPLHSFKTVGTWSLNYFIEEALGENEARNVVDMAYKIAKERYDNGEQMPTPSPGGCVPVKIILEVIEKMLKGGEIVVVD